MMKYNILIVDKDQQAAHNISSHLERISCKTTIKSGVDDALETVTSELFDMLIVDNPTGKSDGIEFLKKAFEIYSYEGKESLRPLVLAHSCDADSSFFEAASKGIVPIDYFIPKPARDADILINARNMLLRRDRCIEEYEEKNMLLNRNSDLLTQNSTLSKEAESSINMKNAFIAQISHEIRTPLNYILNFTGLLAEVIKDKEATEYIHSINAGGRRLIRTIDKIVNISEIQSETYKATPTDIDPLKTLTSLIPMFKAETEEKRLFLTYNNLTTKRHIIRADEYALGKSFEYVLDNALKFTSQGHIEVTATENKDGKLLISFKDTGEGISQDFLKNVLEPFSQETTGYTRKYEGIGLGLSLTKHFNVMNNIGLSIESAPHLGTTVFFTFHDEGKEDAHGTTFVSGGPGQMKESVVFKEITNYSFMNIKIPDSCLCEVEISFRAHLVRGPAVEYIVKHTNPAGSANEDCASKINVYNKIPLDRKYIPHTDSITEHFSQMVSQIARVSGGTVDTESLFFEPDGSRSTKTRQVIMMSNPIDKSVVSNLFSKIYIQHDRKARIEQVEYKKVPQQYLSDQLQGERTKAFPTKIVYQ